MLVWFFQPGMRKENRRMMAEDGEVMKHDEHFNGGFLKCRNPRHHPLSSKRISIINHPFWDPPFMKNDEKLTGA